MCADDIIRVGTDSRLTNRMLAEVELEVGAPVVRSHRGELVGRQGGCLADLAWTMGGVCELVRFRGLYRRHP